MVLDVHLIRHEPELRALEPAWWALWRRCPNATPFASPAWLLPWWACFHPGELRAVAVRAGDRLVALAPLYLEDGPHGRRLLPVGISLSDYLDMLVDPDHAAEAAPMLLAACGPERVDWEELPPEASALLVPAPRGWRNDIQPQSACPVVALPESGQDLAVALPARKMRKLRMARHRAERRGVSITRATGSDAPALMEHLFRLHGERWESRGEPGVLADNRVREFHARSWRPLLDAGLLRLYGVMLDGVMAGVYYGFVHGGRAYAYLGGFDPAFSFESPGTLLLGHAMGEALGEGAREFHLLRGQEPYKYEWGAVDRWNSRRILEPAR